MKSWCCCYHGWRKYHHTERLWKQLKWSRRSLTSRIVWVRIEGFAVLLRDVVGAPSMLPCTYIRHSCHFAIDTKSPKLNYLIYDAGWILNNACIVLLHLCISSTIIVKFIIKWDGVAIRDSSVDTFARLTLIQSGSIKRNRISVSSYYRIVLTQWQGQRRIVWILRCDILY